MSGVWGGESEMNEPKQQKGRELGIPLLFFK
jgi:hypothetical protein